MKEEKELDKIKITIPFLPCSVNGAYSGKVRRYKSNEYVEFQNKMETFFLEYEKENGKQIIYGNEWLNFDYKLYMNIYNKDGTKKKIDTANYEKTLVDTLSKHIEGFDDKNIKRSVGEKFQSDQKYVIFEITEIKEIIA